MKKREGHYQTRVDGVGKLCAVWMNGRCVLFGWMAVGIE